MSTLKNKYEKGGRGVATDSGETPKDASQKRAVQKKIKNRQINITAVVMNR